MRQFTDVSVSKWEDPRASALTSYSITPGQAKTSRYARVLGSAPYRRRYEICDDDEEDETSDSSEDEDKGTDGQPEEEPQKETVPEDGAEGKTDEPTGEEANASAKESEESKQEENVVDEPDANDKVSEDNGKNSEKPPTTDDHSGDIEDTPSKDVTKEDDNVPQNETIEGSDASTAEPAPAKEEESEDSTTTEQATLNESGTKEPDQVTGAISDPTEEDQAKAENTADDKQEAEPSNSPIDETETKPAVDSTESPNDGVTQEDEATAETSNSKVEVVKSEDNEGEFAKLENEAKDTDNLEEGEPDSTKGDLSARNISFAADVKDLKSGSKSSKSKKKKSVGKKKGSSTNNSIPKPDEEATATAATPKDGSSVKPESPPKKPKAGDGAGEEAASVVAKPTSKVPDRKKSILGKQLNSKEKKISRKKGSAGKNEGKAMESKAIDTTQENPTAADATSSAVDAAQPVNQPSENNTKVETPEKDNENSNGQGENEAADNETGERSEIAETAQEDKIPEEKANELVNADNVDGGAGEASCGQLTEKSKDAIVESDKGTNAEKPSVIAEPSSEDSRKTSPNTPELGEEIDEKRSGDNNASEDIVTESEENNKISTGSAQETGHEDKNQIAEEATKETVINSDATNTGDKPEDSGNQAPKAAIIKPESVKQSQSDPEKTGEICKAKPTSTPEPKPVNKQKSSKKGKSCKEITSADLTENVKNEQVDCHILQKEGPKDQNISGDRADVKEANCPVNEEGVEEVVANTDNGETVKSSAPEPSPSNDELPDDIANIVVNNKFQDEEYFNSEPSVKDNVSTNEENYEMEEKEKEKVIENNEAKEDAGDIELSTERNATPNITNTKVEKKATEEKIGEKSESLETSFTIKERKEVPAVCTSLNKETSEMAENVNKTEEVTFVQDIPAEEQPSPVEVSRDEMNVVKDENAHKDKLDDGEPETKDQASTTEDKSKEEKLNTDVDNSKEEENNPKEIQEKAFKQPDDEKMEGVLSDKEAQPEETIPDEQDRTIKNVVPGDEKSENADVTFIEKIQETQRSLDEAGEKNEVSATEANDSFVVERNSDVSPDSKESEINDVKTNQTDSTDLLDCSSHLDNLSENNNSKSQIDNYAEANTPRKGTDDENANHGKIDIVEDTKDCKDPMRDKHDNEVAEGVDQLEEAEISPDTELKEDKLETSCVIADIKTDKDTGESHSNTNSPTSTSDEAIAEPQEKATADAAAANMANQVKHSTDEVKPTQIIQSAEHTASNERNIESDKLETEDVNLKTEPISPDPYVARSTGSNMKDKKKRQDSSRKPRRSSGGSFLSMNASNKSRRDSQGSKPITDKRKSKPKIVENEKDKEEKRKQREAKKDEEIRFLRKELARYEERQKHDQEERHQKRESKKRTENDSMKATKRSSYNTDRNKGYIHSDSQKVEKRKERALIDEDSVERKSKDETRGPVKGKDSEASSPKRSSKVKSSKEKFDLQVENKVPKLPSTQHYRPHSESHRGSRDSRPRSSRPTDSSLKEKKTLHSSSFDDKAASITGIRSPPLSPTSVDMSSTTKVDKDPNRDREIRRSRRLSYKTSSRDKRKNSFQGKDKEYVSILAAGKSLFSGLKNALAKA